MRLLEVLRGLAWTEVGQTSSFVLALPWRWFGWPLHHVEQKKENERRLVFHAVVVMRRKTSDISVGAWSATLLENFFPSRVTNSRFKHLVSVKHSP